MDINSANVLSQLPISVKITEQIENHKTNKGTLPTAIFLTPYEYINFIYELEKFLNFNNLSELLEDGIAIDQIYGIPIEIRI